MISPPPSPAWIAVVIAAHNSDRFIDETLASLIDQDFEDWVCTVVDDGSVDETASRVETFAAKDSRISLLASCHAGVSAARNLGLSSVDTEIPYVMFLDSDDTLIPDALGSLLDLLAGRPDAVGAYGLADNMDLEGRPMPGGAHSDVQRRRRVFAGPLRTRLLGPYEDANFESLAVYGNIWPPGVALVRASEARSAGGFLEELAFLEDWDFFLRVARSGPLVPLDRQVVWYRRRPADMVGPADFRFFRSVATVRHHVWQSALTTPEQRRTLVRSHRRQHASVVIQTLGSLHRPPPSRPVLGYAVRGLALAAYAAAVAVKGRPTPARGLLWKAASELDRRYGRLPKSSDPPVAAPAP
ncbi:MAG TPA: glycosyltransferase [Acidimicrobiales bacterium]|nr:glycosyltransferase [Acidimicrobiales bacterium]